MRRGIQYFQQAVDIDPNYAPAHAGLADCYGMLARLVLVDLRDGYMRAKSAAMRALSLDETLGEAHASLGFVKLFFDWNWAGAEKEFKRAIELNPNLSSAYHWYFHYFMAKERIAESLAQSKRALELDPLDLPINTHLGYHYYYARQYDEALHQLLKTLELDSSFVRAHFYLGLVYEQIGRPEQAINELWKALMVSKGQAIYAASLAHTYAIAGKRDEAMKVIEQLQASSAEQPVSAFDLAVSYGGLKDEDRAFEWLNKAVDEQAAGLVTIRIDPRLDSLRSDPRFVAVLKKIGLDK